jgi:hypothetical protein
MESEAPPKALTSVSKPQAALSIAPTPLETQLRNAFHLSNSVARRWLVLNAWRRRVGA